MLNTLTQFIRGLVIYKVEKKGNLSISKIFNAKFLQDTITENNASLDKHHCKVRSSYFKILFLRDH